MLSVREIAEVICRWNGVQRGWDPSRMKVEEVSFPENSYYWISEYYPQSDTDEDDTRSNSFDLKVKTELCEKQLHVTPEDVEAMLEITGVENTWTTLVPTGQYL